MSQEEVIELIKRELPRVIETNVSIQELVLTLARREFASKQQTDDRFDKLLAQLERMQEESARKWEGQDRKWEENQRRWEEQQKENRQEFERLHEEIMAVAKKPESSIGALGARWGLQSEQAFRNGLAAILEKTFGVQVLNYQDYDEAGYVFGQPDQVELDVIVQNGILILCEIKSSLSRGEVYQFKRKAEFYESKHKRTADRLLVISPMIDDRARSVANKLAIEVYTHSLDVKG